MLERTDPRYGRYIVLEGFHRSGKSTQIPLVAAALRAVGVECDEYEEPPRPGYGRQYVQENEAQDQVIAALLMYADRRTLILDQIIPGLAAGRWSLCSRNFLSSFHLQGILGGVGVERLAQLHRYTMQDVPDPDKIIFLDTSADVLQHRSSDELLSEDALERSIAKRGQSYLQMLGAIIGLMPTLDIVPVDGIGTVPEVTARILDVLAAYLTEHAPTGR